MCKVKFKSEDNNDKGNIKKQNKMDVVNEINQMKQVLQKHINIKKVILLWLRNTYVKELLDQR